MFEKQIKWVKEKWKKIVAWFLVVVAGGLMTVQVMRPDVSFENLPNVAKEQGLYRITFNEWSDVEIGDKNMPEVKLRKWGDETYIKLSYPDFSPVNPKQHKGKLKWVNGDKEVHLYQIGEKNFEFQIIENKKTQSQIVLDIEFNNVVAYYQPPLTEEFQSGWSKEFQREIIVSETDVKDLDGNVLVHRPENIVGSYVFYHATKGNIHPVGEAEKYKTSKIGTLYRPKIIDTIGNWVWGSHEIKNGKLIITRPQEFLDNAVYPIKHASGETFGYTSLGGSNYSLLYAVSPISASYIYAASAGDTITAFYVGGSSTNGDTGFDAAAYTVVSGEPSSRLDSPVTVVLPSSKGWGNTGVSQALSGGTTYCVAFGNDGAATEYEAYDLGATGDESYSSNSGALASSWSETSKQPYRDSIYATYTPSAPPPSDPSTHDLWIKDGKLQIKDGTIQIKN